MVALCTTYVELPEAFRVDGNEVANGGHVVRGHHLQERRCGASGWNVR